MIVMSACEVSRCCRLATGLLAASRRHSRLIFNGLYRSRHAFQALAPAVRHLEGRIGYTQEVPEPFERELYHPLRRAADWLTRHAQRLQSGSVNHYVAYIFAIVLVVLLLRLF